MTPMIMTPSPDLPESDQGGQAEHAENYNLPNDCHSKHW